MALAPALRRLPALEQLYLGGAPRQLYLLNQLGDKGIAALLAPPPQPAGALPPPTGVLTKLKVLRLDRTQISNASCAVLAAALDSGALPALEDLCLCGIPASTAAKAAVRQVAAGCGRGHVGVFFDCVD